MSDATQNETLRLQRDHYIAEMIRLEREQSAGVRRQVLQAAQIDMLKAALVKVRDLFGTEATTRLILESQPLGYYRELIDTALETK